MAQNIPVDQIPHDTSIYHTIAHHTCDMYMHIRNRGVHIDVDLTDVRWPEMSGDGTFTP